MFVAYPGLLFLGHCLSLGLLFRYPEVFQVPIFPYATIYTCLQRARITLPEAITVPRLKLTLSARDLHIQHREDRVYTPLIRVLFKLHYINYKLYHLYRLRIVLFALPSKIPSALHSPEPSHGRHRPKPWPFLCSSICRRTGHGCDPGHWPGPRWHTRSP